MTGTKNASATDYNVAVDGFLVGSSTTAVQESAVAVTYNIGTGTTKSAASGGSYRSNGTLGSVARFKFTGTAITPVTARGPSYGTPSFRQAFRIRMAIIPVRHDGVNAMLLNEF